MQTTCGLDIASTSACACVQTTEGKIVKELNVPATREGEDRLMAVLPKGTAIFMESTGRYHLTWARRLAAARPIRPEPEPQVTEPTGFHAAPSADS